MTGEQASDERDVVYVPRQAYRQLLATNRRSLMLGSLVGIMSLVGGWFLNRPSPGGISPIVILFVLVGVAAMGWTVVTGRRQSDLPPQDWYGGPGPDPTRIDLVPVERTPRPQLETPGSFLGAPFDGGPGGPGPS
ncbi:MAG TPA: hypothetical protein VIU37_13690 [Candidatus Limnocylindrales bacterium]